MSDMSTMQDLIESIRTDRITSEEGLRQYRKIRQTPEPSPVPTVSGIAVIGMSGIFPDAENVDRFWENLKAGKDTIHTVPKDRWSLDGAEEQGKRLYRWGGFLSDIDCFDPYFFNISSKEAELMDPQHRLFLQEAWRAIEDAGYTGRDLNGKKCGVFTGYNFVDYPHMLQQRKIPVDAFAFTGNAEAILPARISYFMNLKGPSVAINTACSSSLVAIHFACESLRTGGCEMALAGGVQVITTANFYFLAASVGILSPAGRCRAFDDRADGIVPGEGVGVVALKRLDAAVKDGDHIYGVITGSGINQDGKTNGITAPSAGSQTELECDVYRQFKIDPETISYVETHGTGTELGDPIEIQALTDSFRKYTDRQRFCAVGSVKTNIGHTMGAAGVASFIKVLLCLREKKWVPSLHFEKRNRHIDFDNSPFFVNTEYTDWQTPPDVPRRAAVSSFAISGTNAHVVLEEYQEPEVRGQGSEVRGEPQLIVLSAKNEDRLKAYAEKMVEFIEHRVSSIAYPVSSIENIAYTLQVGREAMEARLAFVASDLKDLIEKLKRFIEGESDHEGLYRGTVGAVGGSEDALIEGEEGKIFVDSLLKACKIEKLARLWVSGAELDWNLLHPDRSARRISLPTYPFEKKRYWAETVTSLSKDENRVPAQQEMRKPAAPIRPMTYQSVWEPSEIEPIRENSVGPVLLFDSNRNQGHGLTAGLDRDIIFVKPGARFAALDADAFEMDPKNPQDYLRLFQILDDRKRVPQTILHLWNLGETGDPGECEKASQALEMGIYSIFHVVKALVGMGWKSVRRILFLSEFEADVSNPLMEAVSGYAESLRAVLPDLLLSTVQVPTGSHADRLWDILLKEAGHPESALYPEVRYDKTHRYIRTVKPIDLVEGKSALLKNEGVYLITGGAGELGRLFAGHLARTYNARLVLTGRSPLDENRTACLASLRRAGADPIYLKADAASRKDMEMVVQTARERFGSLNGVIHAAGISGEKLVFQKDAAEFGAVLAPKIQGTLALDAATRKEPLDFFVMFSSTSVLLGDFGRCDYAVANRFMDSFAVQRESLRTRGRRHGRTVSINWPLWREGGMHMDPEGEEFYLKSSGMSYLEKDEGLILFERILSHPFSQVAILKGDPRRIDRFLKHGDRPVRPEATGADTDPSKDSLSRNRNGASSQQRVEADLKRFITSILKTPVEKLDVDVNLGNFGLDSISLKAFSDMIGDTFDIDILPSVFFSKPTIRRLGTFLLEKYKDALGRFYGQSRSLEPQNDAPIDKDIEIEPTAKRESASLSVWRRPFDHGDKTDVAVIGVHGLFPGSEDLAAFWQNLETEKDLISLVPAERWDWNAGNGTADDDKNKDTLKWGGFLSNVDRFDPRFFRISPREAVMMDPQHRLFVETVWKTVEDAGFSATALAGKPIGVFAGVQFQDYLQLLAVHGFSAQAATGNGHAMLANRISFLMDWHGPSESIDTACSSSLIAVHRAVNSIRRGECEMAVAGGVSLILSPDTVAAADQIGVLSPHGRCRTLDHRADGYVKGEGIGAVLLKPLDRAVSDRDHIHAVIKGSAVNHGGRANSLTAPNSDAQADVLAAAYEDAGIEPETITYLELHGTGTELGDPVEVEGIQKAFNALFRKGGGSIRKTAYCGLGSVKTNIGHLEPAAGIAGLIKVVLSMQHRKLPGMLHFKTLNPYIKLEESPFYVVDKTRPWERLRDERGGIIPRRAGVSSFGFGGANAHVVVEEYQGKEFSVQSSAFGPEELRPRGGFRVEPQLIVLSAKTEERLKAYAAKMVEFIEHRVSSIQYPVSSIENIAYTLQTGRDAMEERLAFVVESVEEMKSRLKRFLEGPENEKGIHRGRVTNDGAQSERPMDDDSIHGIAAENDLSALARLWVEGVAIDWKRLYPETLPFRVSLPTYPFERKRYWISEKPAEKKEKIDSADSKKDTEGFLYRPCWVPYTVDQSKTANKKGDPRTVLILYAAAGQALTSAIADHHRSDTVHIIRLGAKTRKESEHGREIDAKDPKGLDRLIEAMDRIHHIYFLGGIQDEGADMEDLSVFMEQQEVGVHSLFRLIKALEHHGRLNNRLRLTVLTNRVHAVFPGDPVQPGAGGLWGLARVIAKEFRQIDVGLVDVAYDPGTDEPFHGFPAIIDSFKTKPETEICDLAVRDGKTYRRVLKPIRLRKIADGRSGFRRGGVYLIAGGAGGIGLELSRYLSETYHAVLVLVGRSELDPKRKDEMDRIAALGGTLTYYRGDLTDLNRMESVVASIKKKYGRINGVIHSAIVLKDKALYNMDEETFKAALSPKVEGSLTLHRAVKEEDLDFMLFFSSLQSFTGNAGQANYAAACTFKDAYALYLNQTSPYPVKIINWGYWGSIGIVSSSSYRKRSAEQGVGSIEPEDGMAAVEQVLGNRLPQIVPFKADRKLLEKMRIDINNFLRVYPETITPILESTAGKISQPVTVPESISKLEKGVERLNRAGRCLLLKAFQEMDFFTSDRINLLPAYDRLMSAMSKILENAGWIEIKDGIISGTPALESSQLKEELEALGSIKERLIKEYPEIGSHVELLWACAERYPEILTGRIPATDVIFPKGSQHLVEGIYKNNPGADYFNRLIARSVDAYIEKRLSDLGPSAEKKIRIIEIGAGTGGTTSPVLEAIKRHGKRLIYTYTDISDSFTRQGKKAFGEFGFMEFGLLDIEEEVEGQGYETGEYDVVIAANVLHAAKHVRRAVRHAKQLLKANGWLVLNETTAVSDFSTLTYGLLDGWWRYEDESDRLPGSPLLSIRLWKRILKEEGFHRVVGLTRADRQHPDQTQDIIVADSDGIVEIASRTKGRDVSPEADKQASAAEKKLRPISPHPKETPGKKGNLTASVIEAIEEILANALQIDPSEFTHEAPFTDFGVDSIIAVEIIHLINETFQIHLRTTDLFNYPNIQRLTDHILNTGTPSLKQPEPEAETTLDIRETADDNRNTAEASNRAAMETIDGHPGMPTGEIAVIGMAGRFPDAVDIDSFWRNLAAGKDSVGDVPPGRWKENHDSAAKGGFLSHIDKFDPFFFNISPKEAELMDPQQRLFLQESWRAIEDAGYSPQSLNGKKCGIFVGYNLIDYAQQLAEKRLFDQGYAFTGTAAPILPARISYLLNLRGPSIAINTACSSSLVAVHLACESIRSGTSELAIAGGAQIMATNQFHTLAASIDMLSPDGKCKSFDHRADGFVPGEAVAVVVLKSLLLAERDGDHIYGIIKGSEINQDGKTNGITAPSAPSQTDLACDVYDRCHINPETLGYVETHGTGTELGDPIEIQALTDAFGRYTERRQYCAVGAVKTNIGHTLAAAGISSLIKMLLCLNNKKLVPSLHFEKANPHIDFDNSPFYVNTTFKNWDVSPGVPRRAAVSAFGFSGTNAHMVVEEYPEKEFRVQGSGFRVEPELIVLSAKNEDRLKAYAAKMVEFIEHRVSSIQYPVSSIENIAYTLQTGREAMEERLAMVVTGIEEMKDRLGRFIDGASLPGDCYRGNSKTDKGKSDLLLEGDAGEAFIRVIFQQKDLDKMARLWTAGIDIDWQLLHPMGKRGRVSLPTYPFAMERYWVPEIDPEAGSAPETTGKSETAASQIENRLLYYSGRWEPEARNAGPIVESAVGRILLFDPGSEYQKAFQDRLETEVISILPGSAYKVLGETGFEIDPSNPEDYISLVEALKQQNRLPSVLIHLWTTVSNHMETPDIFSENIDTEVIKTELSRGVYALFYFVQAMVRQKAKGLTRMIYCLESEREADNPVRESISGMWKSLGFIFPDLSMSTVHLLGQSEPMGLADIVAETVKTARTGSVREIRYEKGKRYIKRYMPLRLNPISKTRLRRKGVYLITGGSGGLGFIFARYLAETYDARLILTGRSAISDKIEERIETLKSLGAEPLYMQADAADPVRMAEVVSVITETFGSLNGVIHAAGTTSTTTLLEKDEKAFDSVLKPKIMGTIVVDRVTRLLALDFFVLFSSTASILGDFGQCDYAVANRFLDRFAPFREGLKDRGSRKGHTVAINWPLWQDGGMHLAPEAEDFYLKTSGFGYLETAAGLKAFEQILATGSDQVIVFKGDPNRIGSYFESPAIPAVADVATTASRLEADLREMAAGVLKMDPQRLNVTENMGNYGFDSISLKSFADAINDRYRIEITPAVFFGHSSISALSAHLLETEKDRIDAAYKVGEATEASSIPDFFSERVDAIEPSGVSAIQASLKKDPVAIIGMHGIFPESRQLDEFWRNLESERDMIRVVPRKRWRWEDHFGNPSEDREKTDCKWGGFIDDVDRFDPFFFKISPREAVMLDPQHRLFLESVWKTVEDAGYRSRDLSGKKVGVFAGIQFDDYKQMLLLNREGNAQAATGNAPAMLTNRVSFLMNWQGPSESIDTACSSSLVAVHRAIRSIQQGECEAAIAGGVSLMLFPGTMIATGQVGVLSPDGRCKTLDRRADGYVKGEGVGAVLLKPLSRAIIDGDHIYAVIKGSAVNHGGRANSLTAPNSEAQADVLATAYEDAGIEPETITYLELHGTGTELGDPVEVEGIKKAFNRPGLKKGQSKNNTPHCGLGSVKTNIGHLEPAAGMAGLIKVVLSMQHRKLPGMLHFKTLNPYIKLEESPFYVVDKTRPWERLQDETGKPIPRRAGVSSFGFGGANAHVVVEEYEEKEFSVQGIEVRGEGSGVRGEPQLILLSARNEDRLKAYAAKMVEFIEHRVSSIEYPVSSIENIAYTLQVGRDAMEERLAVVINSVEDLKERLERFVKGAENGHGIYRGNVTAGREQSELLMDDEEGAEYLRRMIKKKGLSKLARLWVMGFEIDWIRLYPETLPRRISLPTYPFERKRYWISEKPVEKKEKIDSADSKKDEEGFLYRPCWVPYTVDQSKIATRKDVPRTILILYAAAGQALTSAIAAHHRSDTVHIIRLGAKTRKASEHGREIDAKDPKGLDRLIEEIDHIDHIYFLGGIEDNHSTLEDVSVLAGSQERGVMSLFRLIQAMERNDRLRFEPRLTVLTNNAQEVFPGESIHPASAGLLGLTRVIAKEFRQLDALCVDIDLEAIKEIEDPRVLGEHLLSLFDMTESKVNIEDAAFRSGRLYVRDLVPIRLSSDGRSGFRRGGVYLIAGGAGGIGLELSRYLSETYHAVLVLVGRSELDPKRKDEMDRIAELGGTLTYYRGDLTDLNRMESVVSSIKKKYGRINGVIHSAIVLKDKALYNMDEETFKAALSPKVEGSLTLHRAVKEEDLDFMLFFSSLQSFTGNAGQANYAAACTFKDAYALYLNQTSPYPVKIINWGYWGSIGIVSSAGYRKRSAEQGVGSIEPKDGMAAVEQVLGNRVTQIVPFKADRQLLEKMGLERSYFMTMLPENFTPVPKSDFSEIKPIIIDADKANRIEKATSRLEESGRLLLLHAFQSMGVFLKRQPYGRLKELKMELNLLPEYDRLLYTMLTILERAGWIDVKDHVISGTAALESTQLKSDLNRLDSRRKTLVTEHPEIEAHAAFLWTCAGRYPDILTGNIPATDVIFPEGSQHLVEGIYKNNPAADYFNEQVARIVGGYVEKRLADLPQGEKVRIIEIGAGTGGTTAPVLETIKRHEPRLAYAYTDISGSFTKYGKKTYGQYRFLEFRTLDIESEVEEQGYEVGGYDVVIAANVLHAANNVREAVRHAKQLIKTNGLLVLNETTAVNDFSTLTYGLLDGWWRYEDEPDRLPNGPILSTALWEGILRLEGFLNVDCLIQSHGKKEDPYQNILIAESDGAVRRRKAVEKIRRPEAKRNTAPEADPSPSQTDSENKDPGVEKMVKETVSGVLQIDPKDLTLDAPYTDIGVDSILAVEIINRINDRLNISLRTTDLFNYPNIRKLSEHIHTEFGDRIGFQTGMPADSEEKETAAVPGMMEETDKEDRFILGLVEALKRDEVNIDDAAQQILESMK